ncbi:MAG: B12-binding domain-containing radical SAM protein [Bacteroidetes bacterium]|nr:B12-binding domain-containing radical SAM protein [Bacteroidota bacterium]
MKVILSHGYFLEEDPKEKEIMKPYPPLGILYVSAFLDKNNIENSVFDSTFSSFSLFKEHLLKEKPNILALYVNLMTKVNIVKIIRFVKSTKELSGTKIILGGPEVRYHAANFLAVGANFIVIGEGEETMLELVTKLADSSTNYESIKSIAFLNSEGTIVYTPERVLIKNIDELSVPARHKVDLTNYFKAWESKHGYSVLSVSTMRGCPYTCKWCSRAVYGQTYRRRSAKLVVDELEYLTKQYARNTFWFVDDVFTVSHKWLEQFNSEIKARNLKIKYECITRADRMNEEVIKLLQSSGCFRVWIGAESGSQDVIDRMDRRVNVEKVREMIQLTKKYYVEAGTFIMLGYEGEQEKDIIETANHLKSSNPDYYTITIAYPIKGTPFYTDTEHKFLQKLNWETTTDRDIDFKRTYSRKYYDYAVRWVYNEVAANKATRLNARVRFIYAKTKSWVLRFAMHYEKLKGV